MDIEAVLTIALPVVYILVGVALIWFLIELIKFLRSTTRTVNALKQEIDPTLAHVETITAALEPVVARVDPLVERISLTVDAANLEIMRVDQILENVTDITEGVSSAVDAVDTAANAPMKLVNTASEKVRGVFKARKASDESVALGSAPKKDVLPAVQEEALEEMSRPRDEVTALSDEEAEVLAQAAKDAEGPGATEGLEVVKGLEGADAAPENVVEVEITGETGEEISRSASEPAVSANDGYFTYTPRAN